MPNAPTPDPLLTLIGLSRSGSPCFPLPEPVPPATNEAITRSDSGYYLDLLEGLSFRVSNGNGAPDLYQRLARARELAVLKLRAALRTGSVGAPAFGQRGTLGNSGNGQLAPAGPLVLHPYEREAGALRITALRLLTTATVSDVPLLLDGEEVARLTSTNAAPQPVSILLPLDGQPHTLAAVLPDGVRALENKLHCPPCSGSSPWGQAVARNLSGVTAATSGHGFILSVAEACTAQADLLAYAITGDDPASQERQQLLAQALMYTAGALLVTDFLTDARFDRYSMLEPKMLPALGQRYEAEATAAVKWLNGAAGLGAVQHPCYPCAAPSWHPAITNQLR